MNEKIKDKIKEIEGYLNVLLEIVPKNIEEYKTSEEKRWSCERGIERIAEALIDLAILVISEKKLKLPEEDITSFEILSKNNIIEEKLAVKLTSLKGMRNRIAHRYGEVDDEIVFNAISEELREDIEEFINSVEKILVEDKK